MAAATNPADEPEVSEEELTRWNDVFSLFDKYGDGNIDNDTLGAVMRALGRLPTESELQKLIAEVDTDGNGTMDFDEFYQVMLRYPKEQGSVGELADAIKVLDHNGDGYINMQDLRHLLTTKGEPLTDEELDALLNTFPADGDGRVSYRLIAESICDLGEEL
ncbi:hypothetical protein BOX15_Mlig016565g1 [Macrostomum lignano]|uniref:EF-hand domain-containing protein n=1 Tax=Macrostomum lignano TaxID=282301 RepID=A0A267DVK5_9PLAT|nr:hypothetical protein BOX15_Mlig005167g2 [Macrostomum lignano]PAA70685.1 hypothetical protein BOX15_Mlig005167g1 [Macrostomum lignano]PAA80662.1 hypothetical protein BOX15_Mlig016565g1 [Macrostomum lignano]